MNPEPEDPGTDRYRLGAELGHGGIGRVVEAYDASLKRTVAVKLVLEGLPDELRQRFVREAELSASLEHPNIVPIYDFGEAGGRPFLAMKRIHGRDLGKVIRQVARGEGGWSRARLLRVFQEVCLAVAFAHGRRVVHRDLKPANVMVGEYGEVLVVDWGLAKVLDEGPVVGEAVGAPAPIGPTAHTVVPVRDSRRGETAALTIEGDLIGTPAYMPPEQAAGRLSEMDERSDVYALGAILFELLAWSPPIVGDSIDAVLAAARAGVGEPPSARARRSGAPEVPPELDAICAKALAFRRENRHASALELHDEVQLFLEGVKERERRRAESAARVADGRRALERWRGLREEIRRQEIAKQAVDDAMPPGAGIDERRKLWREEEKSKALEHERIEVLSRAEVAFGAALAADPASEEAADGRCELLAERFLEAERDHDADAMLFLRTALEASGGGARQRARLDAPGRLSLRAVAHSCTCLAPQRALRVEFAESCDVPWRDGGPRPGVPVEPFDQMVPAVKLPRFGHGAGCSGEAVAGAEVEIARVEVREKRLLPGPWRRLGATPLAPVELPQGSYLCAIRHPGFAEVRLPVRIDRDGTWDQEIRLYRAGEFPDGFCLVPGGPFIFGGRWAGGWDERAHVTRDFAIGRFPVTAAEYLAFLNDLPLEEGRRRQPREADRRFWIEDGGRFRLPTHDESPQLNWHPDWPVLAVSWFDALAYCSWVSLQRGLPFRLAHEQEWEKAARGVDGRLWSFTNEHDTCYSHTTASVPGGATPLPVGSFPADESPYGVRDLSGGAITWCLNDSERQFRGFRALRGGAWCYGPTLGRCAYPQANPPGNSRWSYGLRLALSLTAWE